MQPDIREYLAAERTLLAYVRTALSMMGLGFVVARFSLFLRELSFAHTDGQAVQHGLSLWFGTGLMLSGVAINLISAVGYRRLIRKLNEQNRASWPVARLPIATSIVLSAVGITMAVYLVWIR